MVKNEQVKHYSNEFTLPFIIYSALKSSGMVYVIVYRWVSCWVECEKIAKMVNLSLLFGTFIIVVCSAQRGSYFDRSGKVKSIL